MPLQKLIALNSDAPGLNLCDEHVLTGFLKEFKTLVAALETHLSREEIIAHIPAIRQIAAGSPFVNRAQRWPRGYQGDFEIIGHIITGENRGLPGTPGYLIEDFFITSDICRQHIYKINKQSDLIAAAISANKAANIISIGCGTSEDIRLNIGLADSSQAMFTVVDADIDAIKKSVDNLAPIAGHVKSVHGNIYKVARTLTEKYDLILIGGVFDYLNDKTIIRVLSSLKNNLVQGGKLFFTNIIKNNPHRIFMEYLSNWVLIERSEADIRHLLAESGLEGYKTDLQKDETGLTFLAEITAQ